MAEAEAENGSRGARRKVFLVDGHSLIFRAHYAFMRRPLVNSRGMEVSAIHGFMTMLLGLMEKEGGEGRPRIVVVLDRGRDTFRTELYPDYKAQRAETPEEIAEQTPRIERLIRAMGYRVVGVDGYEADDVIGTLARRFADDGAEVIIVTGDKDALQLVDDSRIKVMLTRRGLSDTRLYDEETVMEEYGVPPAALVDVKALCGDSSDNYPGVKGIGEKTALKLIREHGSLDGVYRALCEIKSAALRAKLERDEKTASLCRTLARIRTDVPIELGIEETLPDEGDPLLLKKELDELELREIAGKLQKLGVLDRIRDEGAERREAGEKAQAVGAAGGSLPPSRAAYTLVTDESALARALESMERAGTFALDTETTDRDPMRASLLGVSLCAGEEAVFYIPTAPAPGLESHLPAGTVAERLARLTGSRDAPEIVAHNVKYDYKVLHRHGCTVERPLFDTMIAAWLLDPQRKSYTLSALAWETLGVTMTDFKELTGAGQEFALVPIEEAMRYACDDASVTWLLARTLKKRLDEDESLRSWWPVEMRLTRVLAHMELAGVWVDTDYLRELAREFSSRLQGLERRIHEEAGREFNINSSRQLAALLFDELGYTPTRKTKTGPSTDMETLETLAAEQGCTLAAMVLQYRHLAKLKGTYVEALPRLVHPETGRIHTTFHQHLTATGRLSSSHPNLQNIPIRTEEGRLIRKAFKAHPESRVLVGADYSQIELRVLAHLSGCEELRRAFALGRDIHRETAALIYGIDPERVGEAERARAKTVNFAIIYGKTAYGLAKELGMTRKEAAAFLEEYFRKLPGLKRWMDDVCAEAQRRGYVETIAGRRRYLPQLRSRSAHSRAAARRIAINTTVQGSAADLMKLAMVRLHERLESHGAPPGAGDARSTRLLLQVHDELLLECGADAAEETAQLVRESMEGAMALEVPLEAKVAWGADWNSLKHG